MARNVFYSFHYDADNWRAAQVRNIGAVAGNSPASDNDWESVKRGGDPAIERWIAGQMNGTSCAVVLIGANTANRKWINHEIKTAWQEGKGLLGVYIQNLKDRYGQQSGKGSNPFDFVSVNGTYLGSKVLTYDPPYWDSTAVYKYISDNLSNWVEAAIKGRQEYRGW